MYMSKTLFLRTTKLCEPKHVRRYGFMWAISYTEILVWWHFYDSKPESPTSIFCYFFWTIHKWYGSDSHRRVEVSLVTYMIYCLFVERQHCLTFFTWFFVGRAEILLSCFIEGKGLLGLSPFSTIFQLYLPPVSDKLYHIMLYQAHLIWMRFELTALVVIGTDWTMRSRPCQSIDFIEETK